MRTAIIALAVLLASGARGQSGEPTCDVVMFPPGQLSCVPGEHYWAVAGRCLPDVALHTDLDRAMEICGKHLDHSKQPASFESSWEEPCFKIMLRWDDAHKSLAERERQAAEQRDLEFVNGIAGEEK